MVDYGSTNWKYDGNTIQDYTIQKLQLQSRVCECCFRSDLLE